MCVSRSTKTDGKPALLPWPEVPAVGQQVDEDGEAEGTAEAHEDVAHGRRCSRWVEKQGEGSEKYPAHPGHPASPTSGACWGAG